MVIKKVALLIPFLLSANAWAGAMEHCPKIGDIKEVGTGTYSAPTVSGKDEWYGTAQSGHGPVGGFEEAVFKAHGEPRKGVVIGELLHCGYALREGGKLDMRFKKEGTIVSIKAGKGWQQWYSQYYCDDKTEGACMFKELVRSSKG